MDVAPKDAQLDNPKDAQLDSPKDAQLDSPKVMTPKVARALSSTLALVGVLALPACGYNMGATPTPEVQKPKAECASSAMPNRFIVHWKDGHNSIEESSSREALARELLVPNRDGIAFAEHDYVVKISQATESADVSPMATPAPPAPGEIDWGQRAVSAADAWPLADGTGITVAVIDSGADITHPQLKNQLSINVNEIAANGVDDDNNGFIDDVTGLDFTVRPISPNIHDGDSGHGTHVSGIVVGEHIGNGVNGIAPGAKLLPLRFISSESGSIGNALLALDYAVNKRGAKIINASWGSESCSDSLKLALAGLEAKGVMFIAAAGNGDDNTGIGYNLDFRQLFPAAYPINGQITVGAIRSDGAMTGFSNFSQTLVHLLAPGWHIWSTYPGGGLYRMDGTSMATPFVTGAAAVVWSYRPKATVAQVKAAILAGVNPGHYSVSSSGSLNVRRALDEIAKTVSP